MSKTELGCQVLQEKGHFADFAQFIRQHGHESEDTEIIMKLKSILWAVVSLSFLLIKSPKLTFYYRVMSAPQKEVCRFLRKKRSFLQCWRLQISLQFPLFAGKPDRGVLVRQSSDFKFSTCFFILGLISSTSQGAEFLDDYRWEATLTPLGLPTGLCIPMDVEKFIYVSDNYACRDFLILLSRSLPGPSTHQKEVIIV